MTLTNWFRAHTAGVLPVLPVLRLARCHAARLVPRPAATSVTRATLTTTRALNMKESDIKRNPHPDFKGVEASRPPFDRDAAFSFTQTAQPNWQPGDGANDTLPAGDDAAAHKHVTIDPYAPDRSPVNNYKLLISAIVPRPIAFVSTRSADGTTTNLAPFSYFQLIHHDPPLFVIGFASSLEASARGKHSLHNLAATGECTINIISEHFLEAANATSVNAPYGVSEWAVSGLTPAYDCETVRCARVREAVFAVEGKLESVREFESRSRPGKMGGTMAVVEGVRFWAREDAVNEERSLIDPAVLKPVSRLGGITYGRTLHGIELLRPDFDKDLGGMEAYQKLAADKQDVDDDSAKSAEQKL